MSGQDENGNPVVGWWASRAEAEFAQITLYRVNGANEELLDRITVTPETVPTFEDFQMMVKGEHGGGIYMAVQRGPAGQFVMRERFAIAGFPKKPAVPVEERPQGQSELAGVLASMQQQNAAMQQTMLQAVEKIATAVTAKPEGNTAPPHENNTVAYINAVAAGIGKSADGLITVDDMPALMQAIVKHENGVQPYPVEDFKKAIDLT